MFKKNKIYTLVFIILTLILFIFFIKYLNKDELKKIDYQEINGENIYKFSKVDFNDASFDIVEIESENRDLIKFYYNDENGQKIENINQLINRFNSQEEELVFAMNGGIFAEDFKPLGLYVENGKEISEINLNEGNGNFFLQPNGVFIVQNKSVKIVESSEYKSSSENLFAVQSGPLLVISDEINSVFNEGSENKYIRNGVGITKEGNIIFAISNEPISFYDFALLFKEYSSCDNALYLDGAISEMYISGEREIVENKFSTMIGIIEK